MAICLDTLVPLRGKIDYTITYAYPREKGWEPNTLKVVFELALLRELSRVVVVRHGGK